MKKLNSYQLRKSNKHIAKSKQKKIQRHSIVLVLDNVLDTYNIGSFFRLGDALAVKKIYLCGPVVTPPNLKIHRASVGTWKWVPWEQSNSTENIIAQLKKDGYQIVVCEQDSKSVLYTRAKYKFPIAIIAGSEVNGVGESIRNLADLIVEIPLFGINKSLNVLIATSIIAFDVISKKK